MKKTTASGSKITFAPFWLVWVGPSDGGPERFPHILVNPANKNNAQPLSEAEALDYWLHSCLNDCTASPEAEECLALLRDRC
jgi:hypothetical protein